jgi:hypothetical protein
VCARAPTSSGARSPHPDARWTRASPPGRCQHDSAEVVVVPAVEDIEVLAAAARVDSLTMEQRREARMSTNAIRPTLSFNQRSVSSKEWPEAGARVTLPKDFHPNWVLRFCRRKVASSAFGIAFAHFGIEGDHTPTFRDRRRSPLSLFGIEGVHGRGWLSRPGSRRSRHARAHHPSSLTQPLQAPSRPPSRPATTSGLGSCACSGVRAELLNEAAGVTRRSCLVDLPNERRRRASAVQQVCPRPRRTCPSIIGQPCDLTSG